MNQNNTHKILKPVWLILPVMALAFYIAFIPHQTYPYPVHIDDWVHMAFAEAILEAGSTTYEDPFYGGSESLSTNLETGFQVFWGVFHRISGLPWIDIFRYFPSVIFALTVLSVYVLAQRRGFGLEAALFACLILTTVGLLGPGFLVPISLAFLFVALTIFVAFTFSGIWSYVTVFIFNCLLLSIHAPSAICLSIILIPYLLLNLRGNFKHSLGVGLALAVPFLAILPWVFNSVLPILRELSTTQGLPEYVDFPRIIRTYGYLPTGLCLLGTLVLSLKGGRQNYGLVLGFLALLVMLVMFFTFQYGMTIVYWRGLMFMMLMMGIMAGAGLMAIKEFRLPERFMTKAGNITRYLAWSLCLVIVGITFYISIPHRQNIQYYHMIDDEDYQAFVWIKENVAEQYDKAILDPWKATPFTAITGKQVYIRTHFFATPVAVEASRFLAEGCLDTEFLQQNGISIIYTEGICDNSDLTEVKEGIYLLDKIEDSS